MRIGVFDAFWSTRGGGERHAGAIAEVLSKRYPVELVGGEPVDLEHLAASLGLDLSRARFRLWPQLGHQDLSALTAGYDLFINATFGSALVSQAPRSAYLVFFPHRLGSAAKLGLARRLDRLFRRLEPPRVTPLAGFYEPEAEGLLWSGETAVLRVEEAAFRGRVARVPFYGQVPMPLEESLLEVAAEGCGWRVDGHDLVLERRSPGRSPVTVELRCRTFSPVAEGQSADSRQLGVCLLPGRGRGRWLPAPAKRLATRSANYIGRYGQDFAASYDLLMANSDYTRGWVERRWGRPAEVLPPPIDTAAFSQVAGGPKRRVILSVGRFFSSSPNSHNKKQVEMLKAFRHLHDRHPEARDWEFHLAGLVHRNKFEDLEYLAELEYLARGYPVRLLLDLEFERLLEEYRQAFIFWHAAGWGENPRRHPERFEHFGITTCEAMSAGCVPVVIASGGQLEIVEHGRSGYLFTSRDELVGHTLELMRAYDGPGAAELAERAGAAVCRYSGAAFEKRLLGFLTERGLLD